MAKKSKKTDQTKNSAEPISVSPILELPLNQVSLLLWEKLVVAFTFLSVFVLYLYTLAPTVPTGDSGELITSAYLLGIPHPPGYPLFNILGKLFSFIPFGNIAWRINLMSAVFSLLASFFIYLTVLRLTKYWTAAILGAVFFSVSPIVWEYSLKAEVFALNNFFGALILYLMVLFREYSLDKENFPKTLKVFYLLFFICGLALTNHHTIILFAPGVMIWILFYGWTNVVKFRTILIGLGAFGLGLLVYLYIPIRAHAQPYMNWDNAQTWHGFIQLVTRADYGSFKLMALGGDTYSVFQQWGLYLSSLIKQFTFLGISLALLGIFFLIRQKDKMLGITFLLMYLLSSFIFFMMANLPRNSPIFLGVFERFYMLPAILAALFIGWGIYFLREKIQKKKIFYGINSLIVMVILITVSINLPHVSQRDNRLDYHYGLNILNSIEQNALLLAAGDVLTYSLPYLQQVEGLRPDIIVLNKYSLRHEWYRDQMQARYPSLVIPKFNNRFNNSFIEYDDPKSKKILELVEANIGQRPIYDNANEFISDDYRFMPIGLTRKIVKKNFWPAKELYIKNTEALWNTYDLSGLTATYPNTTFEKEIIHMYVQAHLNLSFEYYQQGFFDLALSECDAAIKINPSFALPYKGKGVLYANKRQLDKAAESFKTYLSLNPTDKEVAKMYARVHLDLGLDYQKRGLLDLALSECDAAIELDPSLPEPYKAKGVLYTSKHEPEKAAKSFKIYLRLNPNDEQKKAILALIEKGEK